MEKEFFRLTPKEARDGAGSNGYDLVIVGAGLGGGVLAGDLFDRTKEQAKNILVIDRGPLIFATHCLNGARSGGTGDSGQQNDDFFRRFKSEYQTKDSPDWIGGPMYTLGGRSNAWGLFIPRPHSSTLDHFPKAVADELKNTYFKKAESLMRLGYPETKPVHQDFIDRLNEADGVQWKWGKIAAEFRGVSNFAFARGAYSTVDKLLQIAMAGSPPPPRPGLPSSPSPEMKILLNAEVRRLIFGANGDESVTVQLGDKDKTEIKAKRVVLCAGSVHSAAILLRSDVDLESHLHLTDHAMYLVKHFFRYRESNRGKDVGPMKLQTFTKLDDENPVLANFTVDASAFLSSSEANFTPDLSSSEANITSADHFALLSTRVTFAMDVSEPHSVNSPGNPDYQHIFTMVFALSSKLGDENKIVCKDEEEPTITIKRTDVANAKMLEAMRRMVDEGVVETMKKELGAEFDPAPTKTTEQQLEKPLGLGNVAHEVGSLPMGDSTGAVDADLKLRAHKNIYVCDLSVFPVSPAANPSLTLAALALRLSHHLLSVM